jgi:hypothetical protein
VQIFGASNPLNRGREVGSKRKKELRRRRRRKNI